jgi:peroxiredoxin
VRNGALAAVGVFVLVAGPGPGLGSWFSSSSGTAVALAGTSLLAAVLAYACVDLWRENRRLTGRGAQANYPVPLGTGQTIPKFEAIDIAGAKVSSGALLDESQRTVLVFTSATCGPCVGLLPELARWQQMLAGRLAIHVLASGDEAENLRLSQEHGMPVLFDRDGTAANAFGVQGTPSAFAIDETGRVGSPPAMGAPAIEGLIRAALKRPAPTSALEVRHVGGTQQAPAAGAAS